MELSRRTFLRRTGLLLGALGLGSSVHAGLMDGIVRTAKRDFGSALAAGSGVVDFSVEICFRDGFQTNALFPSPGHTRTIGTAPGQRYGADKLNFYWDPTTVQPFDAGNGRSLYLTGVDGAGFGTNPLGAYADMIAISESISDGPGTFNHTSQWRQRFPSADAPAPSVVHAALAPADVPVRGVRWGNNEGPSGVSQFNASLPRLQSAVDDEAGFIGLFKSVPLPFTRSELQRVVGAFDQSGAIDTLGTQQKLDSLWKSAVTLPHLQEPAVLVDVGRNLSTLEVDFTVEDSPGVFSGSAYVPTNAISPDINVVGNRFGYFDTNLNLGNVHFGRGMMHMYQAMAMGMLRTAVFNVDSDDWHTNRPMGGSSAALSAAQGLWANVLTRSLSTFLDFAKNTQNPFGSGSIAESMIISLSSEFSRTPYNLGGIDNGDGVAQSCIFIGTHVNGGTLGDINTLSSEAITGTGYGEEKLIPFDPATGDLAPGGSRIDPGSIYKTHLELMGLSESDYSSFNVDGSPVPALIK